MVVGFIRIVAALCIVTVAGAILYGLSLVTQSNSSEPTSTQIAITGKLACLPHKNPDQPHTLECAIGLRSDDKVYYELTSLPKATPQTGVKVKITGVLTDAMQDSVYNTAGSIKVESIAEVKSKK